MIIRSAFFVLNANFITMGLGLLNSILFVRLIGSDLYGQYLYLIAILAIISPFYDIFDNSILRFLGRQAAETQKQIVSFVMVCKACVFVIAIVAFSLFLFGSFDPKTSAILSRPEFKLVLIANLLSLPVNALTATLSAILRALERYGPTLILQILLSFSLTILYGIMTLIGVRSLNTIKIIACYTWLTSVLALLYTFIVLKKHGWLETIKGVSPVHFGSMYKDIYRRFFRDYTQPLSTGVLFQYIKTYVPTLLIGQLGTFDHVSYYKVFRNLYESLKRTLPRVLNVLTPSAVRSREEGGIGFAKKYDRFSIVYVGTMGLTSILLFIAYPLVLHLFKLPNSAEVPLIVLLFSLDLVVAAFAFPMNYLFNLGQSVKEQYVLIPASNLSYCALLAGLAPFGVAGIVAAALGRDLIAGIMISYICLVRRRIVLAPQYMKLLLLAGVPMGLLAILGKFW